MRALSCEGKKQEAKKLGRRILAMTLLTNLASEASIGIHVAEVGSDQTKVELVREDHVSWHR